jgi:small subunit ribosomal protein S1
MSWTRRLSHPGEMVSLGDAIEVAVLNVNKERQEISLGIKQTETNPWTIAAKKYPSGTIVTAKVRSMTNFGAFVEIEPGIDGMIHISDLSWTKKYGHPSEALQKGQEIKCLVLDVNEEKQRISLGMKQMTEDPWVRAIPEKYIPGHIIKGKVAKLTNFGAFVELEPGLEGLLHISELADHKVDKPQDVVKPGDEVEVKILKVDSDARKIGLSLRRVQWAAEDHAGETVKRGRRGSAPIASDTKAAKVAEPHEEVAQAKEAQPAEPGDRQEDKTTEVQASQAGDQNVTAQPEQSQAPDQESMAPQDQGDSENPEQNKTE